VATTTGERNLMPVNRRILFVIPALLLAASCSSADTLATVNENQIARSDLTALRPSYSDTSTVTGEQLRSDLTLLILVEAVADAASDQFGYEIGESEIEQRLANPPARYASLIAPVDQSADITDEAIKTTVRQTLLRDAVLPELAKVDSGGFDSLLAQRPQAVSRSCVRHISVATVEEADAVLLRLESGEDFEAVAAEVSLDQASPGGLIMTPAGECLVWLSGAGVELANLAATVPLNTPAGPVAAQGQWEVIVVVDRIGPGNAAELTADPMEFLDPDYISALYTPWLNDAVRVANIDVSPTVGRWSETGIGIVAPGE
jgi:hypothetical protein